MRSFTSFIEDDPATCIVHSGEGARCLVMLSPVDLQMLGLLMDAIVTGAIPSDAERSAAIILHRWMESAYYSFTEEEREEGSAPRGEN